MKSFEDAKIEYLKDELLSKHTTYKVGGPCSYMVFPKNVDELKKIVEIIKDNKMKYMILGNGSNVIFSSKKYEGTIINLKYLKDYKIERNKLTAYSGASLPQIALFTVNNGYKGLDFAVGFPASVGGAVFMNAGCYGSEMSDVILDVTYLDENLNMHTIKNDKCKFSYRNSIFKQNKKMIIVSCTIKLTKTKEDLKQLIDERMKKRIQTQPLEKPSAGSVFKNPEGTSAGKLIEDAGLKGKQIGGAKVSEKHANFIINEENATGEDIKKLVKYVSDEVEEKYNIRLETEQEFINF